MSEQDLTDTLEAVRLMAEDAIARGLGREPTPAELQALRQSVDRMRAVLGPRLLRVPEPAPGPMALH